MDELADQIPCRPEISKLIFRDPLLAMKVGLWDGSEVLNNYGS